VTLAYKQSDLSQKVDRLRAAISLRKPEGETALRVQMGVVVATSLLARCLWAECP
jgi:hypothetical protein